MPTTLAKAFADARCFARNVRTLLSVEQDMAAGSATRIEWFLQVIDQQLGGTVELGPPGSAVTIDQRRSDYLRLLRQAPAITEISYLDSHGLEQIRSRLALNVVGTPILLSRSRHASVRSLERYARPGPEAVPRHVAEHDPARRRR